MANNDQPIRDLFRSGTTLDEGVQAVTRIKALMATTYGAPRFLYLGDDEYVEVFGAEGATTFRGMTIIRVQLKNHIGVSA